MYDLSTVSGKKKMTLKFVTLEKMRNFADINHKTKNKKTWGCRKPYRVGTN